MEKIFLHIVCAVMGPTSKEISVKGQVGEYVELESGRYSFQSKR